MSGSVFSETLQQITDTKLNELSKKRAAFETNKASTLSSLASQSDPIERLVVLSNGVKKSFGIKLDKHGKVTTHLTRHPRLEVQLKNLDRFLAQARQDPSVSSKTLSDWEKGLLRHLEVQSLKFQYASLYGQLVTEWLSGDKKGGSSDKGEDTEMGEAFEDVGSSAKLKSKEAWESKAFEAAHVDVELLNRYLESVFGLSTSDQDDDSKKKWEAIQDLRKTIQTFEVDISRPDQFDHFSLGWTIRGLMSSDLLTDEKREVLKDFLGNPVILSEIADVLNLRLAALDSWKWGPDSVPVEQRRKISGVFSIHMHEDVLQAIFLQYIGVRWSAFFREAFVSFRTADGAWTPLYKDIPEMEKRRLEYYLGRVPRRRSLQKERQKIHSRDYFVAKLLKRVDEVTETADGEVEADFEMFAASSPASCSPAIRNRKRARMAAPRKQLASKAARRSAPTPSEPESDVDEDDEDDISGPTKTLMQLKQQLLHLLSTEISINTRLHGELTAFHAVFEDWESLLPHETICTVLSFLGVSQHWLGFFKQYLQAPLRFMDEDHASSKVRRRGVPTSHALSDVLGETVLFCLDLAVNQAASGQPLWRYGDDLWFWSPHHHTAVAAWKAVEDFAEVTGTSINHRKTGTVRVSENKEPQLDIDQFLPRGEIRWGFLVLSPQTGRFEIDHKMVDSHIDELRKQLSDKSSVFSFIQTWNAFAAKFFSSNFGKSANCFGRQHVDDMLATHKRIQQRIFSSGTGSGSLGASSSIIGHLRRTIEQRFGIADVPDGYFYFPVELGGLDLQSPFISLLQIRDSVLESHDGLFEGMLGAEQQAYARYKHAFDRGGVHRPQDGAQQHPPWQPEQQRDRDNFFSADEFVAHREDLCVFPHQFSPTDIVWVFQQLMAQPDEESIDEVPELWTALAQLPAGGRAIKQGWHEMDASWRWITAMYGPEIIERFGELNIVDPGLLPMGMVGLLREKRVTWQG